MINNYTELLPVKPEMASESTEENTNRVIAELARYCYNFTAAIVIPNGKLR